MRPRTGAGAALLALPACATTGEAKRGGSEAPDRPAVVSRGVATDVAFASTYRPVAGARADLVIWSGDPLELSSAPEAMWIGGVAQPLESRQSMLARRYLPGQPREGGLPPSYRR